MQPIIIVGSGLAGYTLAREFRKLDTATPLIMISRDDGAVYSKPMLSNAYTSNKTPESLVSASAEKAAVDLNVTVLAHCEVLSIDVAKKTIATTQGALQYRDLVLALGADPIRPPLTGDAVESVLSVNDLTDYSRFRAVAEGKKSVAIIGTGLIGCEFANDLAGAGFQVDVIGPSSYPLQALIPAVAGNALQVALNNVNWHFGRTVTAASHAGNHAENKISLTLSDGSSVNADVVLSAVGLRSRVDLAKAAGLKVNRGICVDDKLQTSNANIYALGDCAEISGKVMLFILPLMQSARALAQTLAGNATPAIFPHMPVAIKTTVYPMMVLPAPADVETNWVTEASDDGLQIAQLDAQGQLQGFVLTAGKTKQRMAMLARMPAL